MNFNVITIKRLMHFHRIEFEKLKENRNIEITKYDWKFSLSKNMVKRC